MKSNDNNKPTKYLHNSATHTDIDTQKHQKPFRPKEEKMNQHQHWIFARAIHLHLMNRDELNWLNWLKIILKRKKSSRFWNSIYIWLCTIHITHRHRHRQHSNEWIHTVFFIFFYFVFFSKLSRFFPLSTHFTMLIPSKNTFFIIYSFSNNKSKP